MLVLDREAAIAAWRRAEARIYPSVMLNAELYQQYIGLVRDAAFCHRHREITREQGKVLARERLERARREGAEWVVLFEDVTPLGSHRLEMHVASGRALHASSELPLDATGPTFTLEVVQLDPRDGAWLLDRPPVMPARTFDTREEWETRVAQARATFRRG